MSHTRTRVCVLAAIDNSPKTHKMRTAETESMA